MLALPSAMFASGLIDSQCTTVEVRELNRSAHLHN
jgi:hypothetical protein